jgi:hypothetical protein
MGPNIQSFPAKFACEFEFLIQWKISSWIII